MRRFIAPLLVCISMAMPYLKSVEVLPTKADWSGWTNVHEPNNWVGESFVANFDSAVEVQVFLGDTGQSHAAVKVEVQTYPDGELIAQNNGVAQTRSHVWLNFPLTTEPGQKFVRGKEYLLKVMRLGENAGLDSGHSQSTMS